jgi:hypothetical protein
MASVSKPGPVFSLQYQGARSSDPLPREKRYGELFKAARTLFKEGVKEEDQIIPTLAFYNEICQPVAVSTRELRLKMWLVEMMAEYLTQQGREAWKGFEYSVADDVGGLIPVRVVDGILILKRLGACVRVILYPKTKVPREVKIEVYRRACPAKPKQVAELYEELLSRNDIPSGGYESRVDSRIDRQRLIMTVAPGKELPQEEI